MKMSWAKMPNRWAMAGGLREFKHRDARNMVSALHTNTSIAALKTYLAICTRTDFRSGLAKTTYEELGVLLGHSRLVIARSLRTLLANGLIRSDSAKARDGSQLYVCRWLEDEGYAKIPKSWLYRVRGKEGDAPAVSKKHLFKLRAFKLNSLLSLMALKIYILLLALRNKDRRTEGDLTGRDGLTIVSYDRIMDLTGVPRSAISPAITLLLEMNLVSFRSGSFTVSDDQDFDRTNRYLIKGLGLRWAPLTEPQSNNQLPVGPVSTVSLSG